MKVNEFANRLQTSVRSAVNRFGFDVVRLRNSHTNLATHLQNVLAVHEIDCVVDVGANAGQYGQFLRTLGFRGAIVSFEPVKAVFEKLSGVASADPNWRCFQMALGACDGRREINVYASTVFSSFHEVTDFSKQIWHSTATSRLEEVEVRTLDGMADEIRRETGARSFYLKMDTQGHDKNVVAGARDFLTGVSALQSELSMIPVYHDTPKGFEMLQLFLGMGFQVSGMYPVNRSTDTLAVIEYDCVMVRGAP